MSYWQTFYHLVWATKNREPLMTPDIEPVVRNLLVTKANELGVHVYEVNGWTEHQHVVCAIPPKYSVAHIVKMLKGWSSYMLNRSNAGPYFAWQEGYGVLTVGMKQLSSAIEYVQRQKEHHRDGSANVWLERMTEQEDAPSGDPLQTRSSMNMVRETECEYRIDAPAVPFDAEPDWPDTLTDETFAAVAELTFGAP